jgi:DNA-binding transcriptional ArsR family regulator
MNDANLFQALSNDRRLQVLEWLKQPRRHFPPQVDGDLVRDGVCACSIADKLGISQPTLSEHMRILSHAGLVEAKRIKRWTFYKRNEKVLAQVRRSVSKL